MSKKRNWFQNEDMVNFQTLTKKITCLNNIAISSFLRPLPLTTLLLTPTITKHKRSWSLLVSVQYLEIYSAARCFEICAMR